MNRIIIAIVTIIFIIIIKTTSADDEQNKPKFRDRTKTPKYGLIKFEEAQNSIDSNKIKFDDDTELKFDDNNINQVNFNENIRQQNVAPQNNYENAGTMVQGGYGLAIQEVNNAGESNIVKKKRRRRRRKPRYQQQNQYGLLYLPHSYGLQQLPSGFHAAPNQYIPMPSATEAALSSVTEALSSIALNDDYQCVSKLLCDVTSGRMKTGGSGVMNAIGSLQPLLTLIAAYNGVGTSPFFAFGRAMVLGMTSSTNAKICSHAYPLCPSDPEKLVHYLNNYKGGFFRYFNNPHQNNNQNQEQFLNQLSNFQSYGLQQNILPNPNYQNLDSNAGLYGYGYDQTKYGFGKDHGHKEAKDKFNVAIKGDRRILNGQNKKVDNEFLKGTWNFPHDTEIPKYMKSRVLFPDEKSNFSYENNHKNEIEVMNKFKIDDIDGVSEKSKVEDLVYYVVRGNGDPNHPEIVRIKPGLEL